MFRGYTMRYSKFVEIVQGIFFSVFLFAFPAIFQSAYSLIISNVDVASFPEVSFAVDVLDVQGFPVDSLTKTNFEILEDGHSVTNFRVNKVENLEDPIAFVLAIDTSGSMISGIPSALENAVAAAKNFVDSLAPNDLVAVISFSDRVSTVQEFTSNREAIYAALDSLEPSGNTALYETIVKSANQLKAHPEKGLLILLTDGKNYPDDPAFTLATAIDAAGRESMPIYPIAFGNVDFTELQRMADLTGGFLQVEPDSSTLTDAFSKVLENLRVQYLISYRSELLPDSMGHELRVNVEHGSWRLEDSTTYFPRPPVAIQVASPGGQVPFGEEVSIIASVESLAPIASVAFEVNGEPLAELYSPPYEVLWDTSRLQIGDYELRVVAVDANGLTASDITIVQGVFPPSSGSFGLIAIGVLAPLLVLLYTSTNRRKKRANADVKGKAVFAQLAGEHSGKDWLLSKGSTTFGRNASANDVPLTGRNASRFHAVVSFEKGDYVIRSVKADNPVLVNSSPVLKPIVLSNGDLIKMGDSSFRYERK